MPIEENFAPFSHEHFDLIADAVEFACNSCFNAKSPEVETKIRLLNLRTIQLYGEDYQDFGHDRGVCFAQEMLSVCNACFKQNKPMPTLAEKYSESIKDRFPEKSNPFPWTK
jgi:hypothetical protein